MKMSKKEINGVLPKEENMIQNNGHAANTNPLQVFSTKLLHSEVIHSAQFESYFYSLLFKSKSEYYNPINFRHNLDPSFWKDLIDSYYRF